MVEVKKANYEFKGRQKDILTLPSGKQVSPCYVESILCSFPLIGHAMVAEGEARNEVVALIAVNYELVNKVATEKNVKVEDIVTASPTRKAIQSFLDRINVDMAETAVVSKFLVMQQHFSQARGEVTPMEHLVRSVVADTYKEALQQMKTPIYLHSKHLPTELS